MALFVEVCCPFFLSKAKRLSFNHRTFSHINASRRLIKRGILSLHTLCRISRIGIFVVPDPKTQSSRVSDVSESVAASHDCESSLYTANIHLHFCRFLAPRALTARLQRCTIGHCIREHGNSHQLHRMNDRIYNHRNYINAFVFTILKEEINYKIKRDQMQFILLHLQTKEIDSCVCLHFLKI